MKSNASIKRASKQPFARSCENERFGWSCFVLFFFLLTSALAGAVSYTYDELGRLKTVTNDQGETAEYVFDDLGNITSIQRYASGQLAVTHFTPTRGPVGTQVTVYGSGFSTTPSLNTVRFNGTPVAVAASTPNSLTTSVPTGATTGPISVIVGTNTVSSREPFVVTAASGGPPTITGFTPSCGPAGTAITITGTNFDTRPAATRVDINQLAAQIVSITTTQIIAAVPANRGSGKIKVITSAGVVTSAQDFIVPPFPCALLETARRIVVDGSSESLAVNTPGSYVLLLFEGERGQQLGLGNGNVIINPGGSVTVFVYKPNGTLLTSGTVSAPGASIAFPTLPESGTYTIVVRTAPNQTASLTLTLSNDLRDIIIPAGPPVIFTTNRPGQNGRYAFQGTIGQYINIAVSNVTFSQGGKVKILRPDGTHVPPMGVFTTGGGTLRVGPLPSNEIFDLLVSSDAAATGRATMALTTEEESPLIAVDSNPVTFNFSVGQTGRFVFTGGEAQYLGLGISNVSFNPPPGTASILIRKPDGAVLSNCGSVVNNGELGCNLRLPITGVYTIEISTSGAAGNMVLTLSNDLTGELPEGIPLAASIQRRGQNARLTFAGIAENEARLTVNNVNGPDSVASGNVSILTPSGNTMVFPVQFSLANPRTIDMGALPVTGTYTVFIDPTNGVRLNFSVSYLPTIQAGELVINGTSRDVTIPVSRRARLTFAGVAQQSLGIGFRNVVAPNGFTVEVLKPDRTRLVFGSCNAAPAGDCDLNLPLLPVDGTYEVKIAPQALNSASFTAQLSSDAIGTLLPGTPFNFTIARQGQNGSLTFNGSQGDSLLVGIASWNPIPGNRDLSFVVYRPDGSSWQRGLLYGRRGWFLMLPPLTESGMYRLWLDPEAGAIGTMQVKLDPGAPIAINGNSVNVTLPVAGEAARLIFDGQAGQHLGIGLSNRSLQGETRMTLYDSTGVLLNGTICPDGEIGCAANYSLTSTSPHSLVVISYQGGSGNFTATASTDVMASLTVGTPHNLSLTRPGQNGRLTFNGTADEQDLGLILTDITVAGSTGAGAVRVLLPNGTPHAIVSFSNGQLASLSIPRLPVTGTYTVFIDPPLAATANMTVTLERSSLVVDGPPRNFSITQAGQSVRFSFTANAGQHLGLGISNLMLTPPAAQWAQIVVRKPDNTILLTDYCYLQNQGCGINMPNLPASGTYLITVTPNANATASFTGTFSTDASGPLSPGIPVNVNLRNGQNGRYTLSGSEGQQNVRITLANVVINGSTDAGTLTVLKPDGSPLPGDPFYFIHGQPAAFDLPTLPVAGTYTVFIDPPYAASASMTLTLIAEQIDTLVIDGAPLNVTIPTPGQSARMSFVGTVGQLLGLGISNLTFNPPAAQYAAVVIYKPDSTVLLTEYCYASNGGCSVNLPSLPASGNYQIVVTPNENATGSFTATLSSEVSTTLVLGTPFNLAIARPGQNARLRFNGTSGQQFVRINFNNVTVAGSSEAGVITVLKPDGTELASSYWIHGQPIAIDLPTLPASGTYAIFVDPPYAATASATVTLFADVTDFIVIDDHARNVTISTPGQSARLNFEGTLGQLLGLGVSDIQLNPGNTPHLAVTVFKPDNTELMTEYCDPLQDCGLNLTNLPATGTYRLVFTPANNATGSFTVTLSSDLLDLLTFNTPYDLNLDRPGRNALLGFNGTAGQEYVRLALDNVTITGSDQAGVAHILKPNGTPLLGDPLYLIDGQPVLVDLPILPDTGLYLIAIDPPYAATLSMTATVFTDFVGALTIDGAALPVAITLPQQLARLTFNGSQNQNLGLGISQLTLDPPATELAEVKVFKPDQTEFLTDYCFLQNNGCGLNLVNLPMSGTYQIVISPQNGARSTFNAFLSIDLTATLTPGTPFVLNLPRPGQNARLTFSGSAGQQGRILDLANVVVTGSSEYGLAQVLNPDGSELAVIYFRNGEPTSGELPQLPITGTYTVFIEPPFATTSSMRITISP